MQWKRGMQTAPCPIRDAHSLLSCSPDYPCRLGTDSSFHRTSQCFHMLPCGAFLMGDALTCAWISVRPFDKWQKNWVQFVSKDSGECKMHHSCSRDYVLFLFLMNVKYIQGFRRSLNSPWKYCMPWKVLIIGIDDWKVLGMLTYCSIRVGNMDL